MPACEDSKAGVSEHRAGEEAKERVRQRALMGSSTGVNKIIHQ